MIKKIFCVFLSLVFRCSVCFAQEAKVKTLLEGEAAPFTGTLLNKDAIAEILIKANSFEEKCNLRVKKEIEISDTNCKLSLDKLKNANLFEISVYKSQNDFLRDQIKLSVKEVKKRSVAVEWWFVGGFTLGALITIGAGYLTHKISD